MILPVTNTYLRRIKFAPIKVCTLVMYLKLLSILPQKIERLCTDWRATLFFFLIFT